MSRFSADLARSYSRLNPAGQESNLRDKGAANSSSSINAASNYIQNIFHSMMIIIQRQKSVWSSVRKLFKVRAKLSNLNQIQSKLVVVKILEKPCPLIYFEQK